MRRRWPAAGLVLPLAMAMAVSPGCDRSPPPAVVPNGGGPGWAPGLTHVQSRAFLALVLEHFAERGEVVQIDDGWVIPQGAATGSRYGLSNVAEACAVVAESEWPATIAAHFDGLRASQADMTAWNAKLKEWETAKRHLRLRIYPADMVVSAELAVLRRVDLPETQTVAVFDLPNSVRMVSEDDVAGWTQSKETIWAAALANERAASIPTPEEIDLGAGRPLLAFEAPSHFVSSLALRLDQLPGPAPEHGWVVATPTRDFALAYPVTGLGVMMAVNKLAATLSAVAAKKQGAGAISRHLYWWDGTEFHLLRLRGEGDGVEVDLGDPFTKLLNSLASGD